MFSKTIISALALISLAYAQNNNGNNNNNNGGNNNAASSTTLSENAIQSGSAADGSAGLGAEVSLPRERNSAFGVLWEMSLTLGSYRLVKPCPRPVPTTSSTSA